MHVVFYSSLGVNCKMFFHAAVYFFLDFFQNVFAIPVCWTLKMMSTPVHMRELCLRFELLYLQNMIY